MTLDEQIQELLTEKDRADILKLRIHPRTAVKKLGYVSSKFDISCVDSLKSFRKFNGILKYDLSQRVPLFQGFYSSRGIEDEDISKMFLRFPSIIGQNHEKKLRRRKSLGRLIGMDEEDIIKLHVSNPMSTGYGVDRNLAILRILQRLDEEGYQVTPQQLRTYFSKSSPYVPGTRLNIKQVQRKGVLESMPSMYEKLKAVAAKEVDENYRKVA